ncbi:MAG: Rho termination factor N-terminal domain-containing protein [Sedimentisphaerales bacterium]|nr:Rho termination factor N-terminal domain-containing protein [Sedimentisphaerales bacterium]
MTTVTVKPKPIKMPELRNKAKALGVKPAKMKKNQLIHAIQIAEGCTPCFGKSNGYCPNTDCCFIYDCLRIKP